MKITSLRADNFLRLELADMNVMAPILFVAGPNEAGKTSLADAIYHCVTGEARRVKLKKDYGELVHDGAKRGGVIITTADRVGGGEGEEPEQGVLSLAIPSDKRTANITPHPLMPLLLDARRFPALPAEERRKVVLSLSPVKVSGKAILEKMLARGANPDKARTVGAVLLAGFEAAAQEAKTKASEARGAWKATTGEAYGSKKAPDWKAPKPDFSVERLAALTPLLDEAENAVHDATMALGTLQTQRKTFQQQEQRRGELKAVIDGKARAEAKLATDTDTLNEWEDKVARARDKAGLGGDPLTCPHCAGLVVLAEGKLSAYQAPGEGAAQARALLPVHEKSLATAQSFVKHDNEALDRIRAAEAALAELDAHGVPNPTTEELEAAAGALATATAERNQIKADLDVERGNKAAAERADADTARALGFHNDVQQWEAIEAMLQPSGIPSDLIAGALAPLHERLASTAKITGWEPVTIDSDMTVRIGARAYALCSRSAQWRAEAALVEAIAHVAKVGTFMLDEVDVLDAHNRLAFLKWLHTIAPQLQTAIIIGTFKAAPQCPPTFQVEWAEAGRIPHNIVDAEVERKAA